MEVRHQDQAYQDQAYHDRLCRDRDQDRPYCRLDRRRRSQRLRRQPQALKCGLCITA